MGKAHLSGAKSTPPYEFSVRIPFDIIGPYQITAIGTTGSNHGVFSEPIVVDIESAAPIVKFNVIPTGIYFQYAGQQLPLTVIGTSGDGSALDLRHSTLINYTSMDPKVAIVDSRGMVTAVGQGATNRTSLLVRYGNQSVSVPVTVPKTIPGDLNRDEIVNQDDLNWLMGAIGAHVAVTGEFDALDVNHDKVINIQDAEQLVRLCTKPCIIPNH